MPYHRFAQLDPSLPVNKRILVVDDDRETRHVLGHALNEAGYYVWSATSADVALNLIERHGVPHLALVEATLRGMNGFQFCDRLHQMTPLPIIMLSADGRSDTVVRALEGYAEDCIIKPFSVGVLLARVQRVLRRMEDFNYTLNGPVQVDESLHIDFKSRQAIIEGEPVTLTPTEAELLYILQTNAGRTVPTASLLRRLWPLESVAESRLHVHVARLRRKIEFQPERPYILSMRGAGYSFRR